MTIFLLTFVIMGIAILAMAIGVLLGRRSIGGSCGGLGRIGLECDAGCDKPCPRRLSKKKMICYEETVLNKKIPRSKNGDKDAAIF